MTPDTIAKPVQVEMNLPAAKPKPQGEPSSVSADDNRKTWGEFFKMVGMDVLSATAAQKNENTEVRTQQIEEGIAKAKESGLGDWTAVRAGRSFERIETAQPQ